MKKILFFIIFFIFCQKRDIFKNDKELVNQFLNENKDIISIYSFLEKSPKNFFYSSPLSPLDTLYKKQKVFERIAYLIGFYRISYDTFSFDSLRFFIENNDTFCEIIHLDSMRHCIAIIQYDTLWRIFFNDSLLDSIKKISYGIKEYEKIYPINAQKKIILKKREGKYQFYKISPTYSFFPSLDTAPTIEFINLKNKLSTTIDSNFFKNLILLEELPSFSMDESITIQIKIKENNLEEYFVFLHYQNERFLFKKENNIFYLKIKPNKKGLNYLTIEVLTSKTLFYFKEKFIYHLYQIPIFCYN
ncbi:MAG: hypothetical protein RMJ34_02775 [candidate division WOR-3 bacterium]|nr:hypothetical protein [candidate division WOR-3 bacterium]MDW8113844.1 hypothetical protein [candidate division WOR-3 bacterium]